MLHTNTHLYYCTKHSYISINTHTLNAAARLNDRLYYEVIVRLGASKTQPVTAYHRSNSTVYACLIVQLFVVYPKFATQQRSTTTHTNTFSPYYDEPPEKSHSVSRAQTEFVREQHCSRDLHTKTVLSVCKEIAAIRSREALLYIYSDALSSHRPLFFLWYWKTAAPFLLYIIYTHIHIYNYLFVNSQQQSRYKMNKRSTTLL